MVFCLKIVGLLREHDVQTGWSAISQWGLRYIGKAVHHGDGWSMVLTAEVIMSATNNSEHQNFRSQSPEKYFSLPARIFMKPYPVD